MATPISNIQPIYVIESQFNQIVEQKLKSELILLLQITTVGRTEH